MVDLSKNALGSARSPYLRQHAGQPVHWQEWNAEVLAAAKREGKLILVSIGYATCHWCHVMAREAFSDAETAEVLNRHFVPIKVDREERPDIDRYFIDYVASQTGSAGWPLNVLLSPEGDPLVGGTYFPLRAGSGRPGFADLLTQVVQWWEGGGRGQTFRPAAPRPAKGREPEAGELIARIAKAADPVHGGFGDDAKFPPHTTLLFLLWRIERGDEGVAARVVRTTLDAMALRGLHDHLQGGFFRYCVDRAWTVPHFEKMLYDQAMLLWVCAVASRVLKEPRYAAVATGIIRCLEETFREGDLYVSAHDADTDHAEGATYLWTEDELTRTLGERGMARFHQAYDLEAGAVEGKIHLLRASDEGMPELESQLLAVRKRRPQPFVDRKIVTAWNALLGIALCAHGRMTGTEESAAASRRVLEALLARHVQGGEVARSSLEGETQPHGFLEDHAALLLLSTYALEDSRSPSDRRTVESLLAGIEAFREDGAWYENRAGGDFRRLHAESEDRPLPGSAALADAAVLRATILLGREDRPTYAYGPALAGDFHNLVAGWSKGLLHEVHAPRPIDWSGLPPTTIQVPGREYQDCDDGRCRRFKTEGGLLAALAA